MRRGGIGAAAAAAWLAACGATAGESVPATASHGAAAPPGSVAGHVPSEEEQLEAEIAAPVDAERTPRALRRLASLRARRAAAQWEPGDEWAPRAELEGLSASIALVQRVVREFPRSPHTDDALLFLGELEHGREADDAALRAWLAMVCVERAPDALAGTPGALSGERAFAGCTARTTDSALRAHAWIRIAELAFDLTPGLDLGVAIEAYRRSIEEPGASPELRAIGLYKRAWALYRSDRYADALVDFATLAVDEQARPDLRSEAIQYMAISIVERDWNLDGRDDPMTGLDRPEAARWIDASFPRAADVLRKVAEILSDETDYGPALRAYDLLMTRFAPFVTADDRARRDRVIARAVPPRSR